MTFDSEDVRYKFHQLDTGMQYAITELEMRLNAQKKFLHIEKILPGAELVIRVTSGLVKTRDFHSDQ